MAAITIASFVMFERTGTSAYNSIAAVLLILLSGILSLLLYRTFLAIRANGICVPGH